ncbi:MAG: hypothetical protein VST70_07015 [Nitrospirota bacterium]|nr:hypothetical protein [Nitrospirota bacterium]
MAYSDTLATGGPCAGEPSETVAFRTLLVKAIILNNTLKNPDGFGGYSADAALLEWSESAGRAFSPNCPKLSRSTLTRNRSRDDFF